MLPGFTRTRGAPGIDRLEHVLRLEVDVGDHRDLALLRDDVQHVGVVLARHRDAHDVAAGCRELGDLLQGRVDVRGRRRAHRLHADLGVAADQHLADLDLAGLAARSQGFGRRLRHSDIQGRHALSLRGATPRMRRATAQDHAMIGLTMSA